MKQPVKCMNQNSKQAQTGPAVRYDENVINKHLEMLADEPEMQELYQLVSENIHRLHNK